MSGLKTELRALWQRALRAGMSVDVIRGYTRRLAQAGRVPKKLWNRLPIVEASQSFVVELSGGARFRYRASSGDAIGQALYWRGVDGWERATTRALSRLVRGRSLFLDIGANTGAYTLIACAVEPAIQVVAYEPVPRVFDALVDNIALGGLSDRCQARQMAVSSEPGQTRLSVPHAAVPSSASLAPEGFRNIQGELITVAVTTVDEDIPAATTVDVVKIDVEGFEHQVLAGMTRVLRDDRPIIICECNPDGPYREVEAILTGAGYAFMHIRDDACQRMPHIVPDASERFRNFACVPEEKLSAIEKLLT